MLDIAGSILATTTVTPGKIATGEGEAGPFTQRLTIQNKGTEAVTYNLSSVNALSTGGVVTPTANLSNASGCARLAALPPALLHVPDGCVSSGSGLHPCGFLRRCRAGVRRAAGAALAGGTTSLKMFGEYVPIRAEVSQIEGLSAHADQQGLLDWLEQMPTAPRQVMVTHGEPAAADTLRLRIEERLGWPARVPDYRETLRLG